MRLGLYCVGRISEDWLRRGVDEYAGRIRRYLPLEIHELKEEKSGRKPDPGRVRELEGKRLLERLPKRGVVLALDENGRRVTSRQLAGLLERQLLDGCAELALAVGGAYGLSDALKTRADEVVSLSPLTLTHQLARLLLFEQLYRALTIVRNEPYHNP